MEEPWVYILFLFAWVFFQSLWLSKLGRQVAELRTDLAALRRGED